MSERKKIVGFANFNSSGNEKPAQKETKVDYVRMALQSLLKGREPYNKLDDKKLELMTSKEIQEKISSMVIASVSTITEYMVQNGYHMILVEGGGLAWAMQDDLPF